MSLLSELTTYKNKWHFYDVEVCGTFQVHHSYVGLSKYSYTVFEKELAKKMFQEEVLE